MNTKVQFLFDFGSPNAYLCHQVIPRIEARSGIRFEYVPVLLGGLFKLANNRSPAEANADIPNKRAYEALELQRFVHRHSLTRFRMNPHFPVNTLQIMRGAVAAQDMGCFERYVDAVFSSMWEKGCKMDDAQVIGTELSGAGLDAPALIAASQTQKSRPGCWQIPSRPSTVALSDRPPFLLATRSISARTACAMWRKKRCGPEASLRPTVRRSA
jgi:2-hydroxychromene-2-carboxylate isomerase